MALVTTSLLQVMQSLANNRDRTMADRSNGHSSPCQKTLPTAHILLTHTHCDHYLEQLLTQKNADITHVPMLAIKPLAVSKIKQKALYEADTWVFLSKHSLGENAELLRQHRNDQCIVAIGPGTAHLLNDHDITVDYVPEQDHSSDGILALPLFNTGSKRNILVFSEASGPAYLKKGLKERGHAVIHAATYQHQKRDTTEIAQTISPIIDSITHVTAHSQKGLDHLHTVSEKEYMPTLKQKTLLVTSQHMRASATEHGFQSVICSDNNGPTQIVNSISAHRKGAIYG